MYNKCSILNLIYQGVSGKGFLILLNKEGDRTLFDFIPSLNILQPKSNAILFIFNIYFNTEIRHIRYKQYRYTY